MQKIDPAYLYQLGALIRPLTRITAETDMYDGVAVVVNARDAVAVAISPNNLYTPSLRQSRGRGEVLISLLNALIEKMNHKEWLGWFDQEEVNFLQETLIGFESAYLIELQNAAIYYVQPKGGFDIEGLIGAGENLFPRSLGLKVSSAIPDVREGARSLAFQLWTGAGYHFHRANEAVLRAYFDHEAGAANRKQNTPMGGLLKFMKDHGKGDPNVRAALENLVRFHRNPLIHPEHSIESEDEAISLYAAIRAAMGYMLDKLPDPPPSPPMVVPAPSPAP